jgi:ATP-binding cassette, subfamily G (WHITE), member 2, SNQ2
MSTDAALEKELEVKQPVPKITKTSADNINRSSEKSDTDTIHDLDHDYEKGPAVARTESRGSTGLVRVESGVDVEQAERDFAELNKQLSAHSRRMSRAYSRQSAPKADVEKAISSDETSEDTWDLEETLRGAKKADVESGIKSKYIGVIWDNVTVRGIGGVKNIVKVFPDAFIDFFNVPGTIMKIMGYGKKGKEFNILQNFRGVAKPGEMVLVLGRPGSGCTTLLKVLANQRFGYTAVEGDVQYGPFEAATFAKRYRGEAVYNQEDDVHHPTLTVGQTLGFALDLKTPGKRPNGMSKKDFKDAVIKLLLKMFNIEHTINTIVGNPFARGVSGGERKRVSIAEMMITGATVCAWDNSTRGLDASTASDYAKSLRVMTNIYKTTTFVSLYQASETIYRQFDKVLVIDSGRQVFFGPAQEARKYFEDLGFLEKPRQTTPDYLTGCTDEYEREYKPGRSPENAPSTADSFVEAFDNSIYAEKLKQEMNDYRATVAAEAHLYEEFQAANREAKQPHTGHKSVYSSPLYLQIWALMQRQFILKWQDKFNLCVSWVTSLTIAIVVGTVWLDQPETSAGAFTRGGVLFIALLFNAFQAFSELGSTMLGRPIVNKHRAFAFHRPSALWLAQICVDLAFASVQIFVFSVIVYFMTGLVRTAGAFFTFVLIIITGYLMMTLFFRTIGCLCPDFDYAIKFAATIITLFVITSGYIIQYQSQQVWIRWIFYINVLGLGFSAMMMNEFSRLTMTCTSESLVPSGPSYDNLTHQVCTLPGSRAGSDVVSGTDYILTAFSYDPSDLWRNFGIIVAMITAFLIANVYFGEKVTYGAGGRTITFFQKENSERKALNDKLQERKRRRQLKQDADESSELTIASKAILTWENLTYDVPTSSGQLRLLKDVFGYVRPGQLTALMGASGAGKTTLLDVLAARKNIGTIGGDILVDGEKPGIAFQRGTSYAEQLDVHESTQTVREALRFSAELRQPYDVPREVKYAYVEEVLGLLELENLADAIIGTPESGLSVEERKRVTIGVELAAKPQLLLFLDEPTSGLDSQSAFNIVRFLRKLAAAGQAILCTIHQPNSALFENFDRLLLLQKGGETVYFGEIGKDAHVLLDYFHQNGADCPPDANPAEWMLDAIGAGIAPRIGDKDWGDIWRDSNELATTKEDIISMKNQRRHSVSQVQQEEEREFATPLWHQIQIVSKRTHIAFWRSPNYGFTRLFNHVIIALLTGLNFLQLDDSRASLQYRVFVIFQVTVVPALILAQVEPMYDVSRLIYYREAAAKAYKQLPFALSMVQAEMPYSLLCAVGFFVPIYYLPGFNNASSRAGYQFLIVLITELFSVTAGQMIAACTPSAFIASLLNPFVVIIFALFCGVAIPKPQIPHFWRAWLYELDPFTRLVSGMVVTELHSQPVNCLSSEYNSFPAPQDTDCGSYMQPFFEAGGNGYLRSNISDICEFCAFRVGDQFYDQFQISFNDRWRDLGIFAAFIVSNLVILFMGSRWLNFNRR